MRILVTGGAGYIGSVLVPMLLRKGHDVTVVDNFMYRQTSLFDCCNNKNLTIVNMNVRDLPNTHDIQNAEVIIPLAALVGAPACDIDKVSAVSTNVTAIKEILTMRDENQKIISPCTNSGYGIGEKSIYCTEETPLKPISFYAKLKVEAEQHILEAGNSISLRLATVFGISPKMRLDLLVNDFTYKAVMDRALVLFEPHFKRDYIHVRDVARAFIHAIDNFDTMKNQVYNVGLSDTNISKWELCEEIKKQIPSFYFTEAEIGEDPDKRDYIVSNDKIEATGYKPIYSLQDGIRELIKGYQIIKRREHRNA